MSNILFTSDPHLGHPSAVGWRRDLLGIDFHDVDNMNEWVIDCWNKQVAKRDVVWILGDVAWNNEALKLLDLCHGIKHVVLGNHDKNLNIRQLVKHVNKVFGIVKNYDMVFSHCPVHPSELQYRWNFNVHGHIHHPERCLNQNQYFNVNIDVQRGRFVPLEELKATKERLCGG